MPLSFLYYYVAEQWSLVQQKMAIAEKNYHDRLRTTIAFKPAKNADISLWQNGISVPCSM